MSLKGSHMGLENTGRKTPQRARLSDITNIAPPSVSNRGEDSHILKGCEAQLHKELANLRKALAEKEELIQAQKVTMEKLWTNYTRKTKQNEEIIQQNGCLYKEVMQARDTLKILQHAKAQMVSVHKAIKSELQAKLARALEQADHIQKVEGPPPSDMAPCDKQSSMPNLFAKLAESRARRTVITDEPLNEPVDLVKGESLERSARRRASLSYKEPSLKTKLRQVESSSSQVKPCINRRGRRIHQLHTVCEEEMNNAFGAMPLCSIEDEVAEISLPYPQKNTQNESSSAPVMSGDVLKNQNLLSSIVAEANSEQPPRPTLKSSASIGELPSERLSRRSAVGSITSYKEAPLNSKLRRSSESSGR